MAGAEAAVQRVICERPQVSQRLIKGSKFLKWPKSDGDVSLNLIQLLFFNLFLFGLISINITWL